MRGDTIAVRRGRITTYYKQTQTGRRITDSSNTGNIFTTSMQPKSDAAFRINKPLQNLKTKHTLTNICPELKPLTVAEGGVMCRSFLVRPLLWQRHPSHLLRRGVIGLTCLCFANLACYLKPAETLLDARVYKEPPWYQLGSRWYIVNFLLVNFADKASVSCGVDAEGQDNASHRTEEEEETDEEGQEKEEEDMEEEVEERKEEEEEEKEESGAGTTKKTVPECDYINARACCSKLNKWVIPEMVGQCLSTMLMLVSMHWFIFLLNLPVAAWNIYRYVKVPMGNMGVFDPTEIHNRGQLKSHMKEAMIKLGYHLLCFFIYLYSMILALIND
ncbi:hypothetical protein ABVT39_010649 [Epinephelus coioides]